MKSFRSRSSASISSLVPLSALLSIVLIGLMLPLVAFAQDAAVEEDDTEGFGVEWTPGPFRAALGKDLAEIDVPEGYLFCGAEDTQRLMEYMGNPISGSELGTLVPVSEDADWLIVFEFADAGYVRDTDKDDIDAGKLLKQIRKGNEGANEYRREHGVPPLEITGWQTEPYYDDQSHNLVWSLLATSENHNVANHNTRVLGRTGYMSVTIVATPDQTAAIASEVEPIMNSFAYVPGKQYAEYKEGDRLAQYGLGALVVGGAGVAAAKLGLFAVLAKFLAKAWKLLVAAVFAIGAFLRRLFGGRSGSSTPSAPTQSPQA